MPFFVNNQCLNNRFPLASCPPGSLNATPWHPWFERDFSTRYLAALFINDTMTMTQIQQRLTIQQACKVYFNK